MMGEVIVYVEALAWVWLAYGFYKGWSTNG